MDVRSLRGCAKTVCSHEDGFTLIESVVATGLFAGVVLLLVSVFSSFLLDTFPSRSEQALSIAQSEIANVQRNPVFESSSRDTLGFHVTREVRLKVGIIETEITISSGEHPAVVYAVLTSWRSFQR